MKKKIKDPKFISIKGIIAGDLSKRITGDCYNYYGDRLQRVYSSSDFLWRWIATMMFKKDINEKNKS